MAYNPYASPFGGPGSSSLLAAMMGMVGGPLAFSQNPRINPYRLGQGDPSAYGAPDLLTWLQYFYGSPSASQSPNLGQSISQSSGILGY